MKRLTPALIVGVAAVLALSGSASLRGQAESPTVPGELLVRVRDGANPADIEFPGEATYNERLNVWRVEADDERPFEALALDLEDDPAIEFVQPQYRYVHAGEPDDQLYRDFQHVHYRTINLQGAWEAVGDMDPVTVAVLDGGVDVAHPELDSRTWSNAAEVVNGIDDDANGCIDDTKGCSFQSVPPDGDIRDRDGHGTFVAGLIAGEENNGEGVAGIASNARIMPVRALDPDGSGDTEELAQSVLYAAEMGAQVMNLSLVLPPDKGTCPTDPIVEEALRTAAEDYGVTILAAAGNFSLNCVGYPASSIHTVAVAASGPAWSSDSKADFSQWGPEVDIAAPGVGVVSTCPIPTERPTSYCPGDPYGQGDGTSFSTPFASGVAALLVGSETLVPAEVRQRLRDTARDLPDGDRLNWDGAGMIDAGLAIGGGSVVSSLDVHGDTLSELDLIISAGEEVPEPCSARLWDNAQFPAHNLASSALAGECGAHWPPTAEQPWNLVAESRGGKAAVINSWSLASGGMACASPDAAVLVPPGGQAVLSIDCESLSRVTNDRADSALVLLPALPRKHRQDIRYATADPAYVMTCDDRVLRSAWYLLPPSSESDAVAVDTFGSEFQTAAAVYQAGGGGMLSEIACDSFGTGQSRIVFEREPGITYLVQAGASGILVPDTLVLNVSRADVPANDEQSSAVMLAAGAPLPFIQPAHSALTGASDPAITCTADYGLTLWFRVTAPASGPLTASTAGSNYDTTLAVFDGAAEAACNDEAGPGIHTSRATWGAEQGKEYWIVVGSFRARPAGTLQIKIEEG